MTSVITYSALTISYTTQLQLPAAGMAIFADCLVLLINKTRLTVDLTVSLYKNDKEEISTEVCASGLIGKNKVTAQFNTALASKMTALRMKLSLNSAEDGIVLQEEKPEEAKEQKSTQS